MSYQVAHKSKNVLLPIALEDRLGNRITSSLSKLDTATAMVIQVSTLGSFSQDFFPLQLLQDDSQPFSGRAWQLRSQKTGSGLYCHYLGIPDDFFSNQDQTKRAKSISVQVIGSSPLTGGHEFSGGVDVNLHTQITPPLISGFLNLSERFFPTLLSHHFISNTVLDVIENPTGPQFILKTSLELNLSEKIPMSLEKNWDPKNWVGAVVEHLTHTGYFLIQGGCFYDRNQKLSHWFGSLAKLKERNLRKEHTEKIHSMGSSGKGSWVFWLEPIGLVPEIISDLQKKCPSQENDKISIRHPVLHKLLHPQHFMSSPVSVTQIKLANKDAREVVEALNGLAKILMTHQLFIKQSNAEPDHGIWSQILAPIDHAIRTFAEPESDRTIASIYKSSQTDFEKDIANLYHSKGETLRVLESMFDEVYGYSPWDTVGNPLREILSDMLSGKLSDPALILESHKSNSWASQNFST